MPCPRRYPQHLLSPNPNLESQPLLPTAFAYDESVPNEEPHRNAKCAYLSALPAFYEANPRMAANHARQKALVAASLPRQNGGRKVAATIERSADLFCRAAALRFKSSCKDRAKFATHLGAMLCTGSGERNGRARVGAKKRGPQEQGRATLDSCIIFRSYPTENKVGGSIPVPRFPGIPSFSLDPNNSEGEEPQSDSRSKSTTSPMFSPGWPGKKDFVFARVEGVEDLDILTRTENGWTESYYQIKSRKEGTGNWTIARIENEGVLSHFYKIYENF